MLGTLLLEALSAVLIALLTTAAGTLAKRKKLAGDKFFNDLAGICYRIFLPCLLFGKVGKVFTVDNVIKYGSMTVCAMLMSVGGAALAWCAGQLMTTRGQMLRIMKTTVTWGNANSVPLPLLISVCSADIFLPLADADGSASDRAVAYNAFFLIPWSVMLWSIGLNSVRPRPSDAEAFERLDEESGGAGASETMPNGGTTHVDTPGTGAVETSTITMAQGSPTITAANPPSLVVSPTKSEKKSDAAPAEKGFLDRLGAPAWLKKGLFTPPALSATIACICGLIPFVHDLLFVNIPPIISALVAAVTMLGNAAVPCSLMCLGANLASGPQTTPDLSQRTIAVSVVARLLVTPLVFGLLTYLAFIVGVLPKDPVYLLVLFVQAASPAANNLNVVAALVGRGAQEIATILFWQYSISAITIPLLLSGWVLMLFSPVFGFTLPNA